MLTIGTDSYITISEADKYLKCVDGSDAWFNLDDDKKEFNLRRAAWNIDALPLNSYKSSIYQDMQFPRGLEKEIPEQVKLAQALEALALSDVQSAQRRQLKADGITSVTLGSASESYSGNSSRADISLISGEAYKLLRRWIKGSVVIR